MLVGCFNCSALLVSSTLCGQCERPADELIFDAQLEHLGIRELWVTELHAGWAKMRALQLADTKALTKFVDACFEAARGSKDQIHEIIKEVSELCVPVPSTIPSFYF